MVRFEFEAMNAAGQAVASEVDATSLEEAVGKIKSQGCYPTKVRERPRPGGAKAGATGTPRRTGLAMPIIFGGVSLRALAEFTRQLSTLQDAGLPLLRSLKILWQQERGGILKHALADVAAGVEDGNTISESMARHPRVFNRLYVNMVAAGETGGVLDVILQRLAEFMEKSQKLRRRIIGAMIYPAVVIAFSILIVTGVMMFVVPRFQGIFRDFRVKMPWITEALMSVSNFIAHDFGWVMILGTPVAAWLLLKFVGKSEAGRGLIDTVKLRLPIAGRIVRKAAVARFARTLGTLLAAGVPILEAVLIARDTVGNAVFARLLQKVHDGIREGASFAAPLRAAGRGICDPVVTNMIEVGEETGELDKMLLKIADNAEDQVDVLVGSLVSLLEPVMVIGLGGIVGTIVVALFMPLATILTEMANGGAG